ncbi:MAG: AAA family ATPase [Actinomycetota bacterium]
METGPIAGSAGGSWLLERSAELAVLERSAAAVLARHRGRLALVTGEAGVGKTALLRAFSAGRRGTRVLWGACDPLLTPRPLAPLVEIAGQAGGDLAKIIDAGAAPAAMIRALAQDLAGAPPAVVVLEDLHWADEATLDLLRVLGRQVTALPALVIVTYRDGIDRADPLRVVLGELPAGPHLDRLQVLPLSLAGVIALVGPAVADPAGLHRRTGGNPFFVTEVLAAGGAQLPDTVRDAVLARAARLG